MTDIVERLLAEAKELVRARGRAIGCLEDTKTGALCIIGALRQVANNSPYRVPYDPGAAYHKAYAALWRVCTVRHSTIARFNDDPDTTDDMVSLVFDAAIKHATPKQP